MPEEFGIKETKEAVIGVFEVAIELIKGFKDGVQLGDFVQFWNDFKDDPEFQQKLKDAYEGIGQVPDEIGDLDAYEGVELVGVVLPYIPKIIEAFKKEQ